jgi:hypothetical protein
MDSTVTRVPITLEIPESVKHALDRLVEERIAGGAAATFTDVAVEALQAYTASQGAAGARAGGAATRPPRPAGAPRTPVDETVQVVDEDRRWGGHGG